MTSIGRFNKHVTVYSLLKGEWSKVNDFSVHEKI